MVKTLVVVVVESQLSWVTMDVVLVAQLVVVDCQLVTVPSVVTTAVIVVGV